MRLHKNRLVKQSVFLCDNSLGMKHVIEWRYTKRRETFENKRVFNYETCTAI